ncbi:unnamed protein product [Rotaria socialis]
MVAPRIVIAVLFDTVLFRISIEAKTLKSRQNEFSGSDFFPLNIYGLNSNRQAILYIIFIEEIVEQYTSSRQLNASDVLNICNEKKSFFAP